MNEQSISELGQEFKAKVKESFGFLQDDFGFESAVDESSTYAHRLTFRSVQRNQLVEVVNAFHGIDYGFEINIHSASGPRSLDQRNMVYYRLKEEQDIGFAFLTESAEKLRTALRDSA